MKASESARSKECAFCRSPICVECSDHNLAATCLRTNPTEQAHDAVNHPRHYTSHPSGIECIDVTRHMGFNLGNAMKYIWRADLKNDAIEDLRKAMWYLNDEIKKREAEVDAEAESDVP